GKSTLIKILSGAYIMDSGTIRIEGKDVAISSPSEAKAHGIETLYQSLALADNLDAVGNLFLGREIRRAGLLLDRRRMLREATAVCRRINPRFTNLTVPV